jgi:hypothetical protein
VDFRKEIDLRQILKQSRAMAVSAWNNAVLQQRILAYNFRPKTEWPDLPSSTTTAVELRRATASLKDPLTESIAKLQAAPDDLPPASIFKPETPRYPNVWFYGPESNYPTYKAFIDAIARRFRDDGYTADAVTLNEGADLALSIENLQPWTAVQRLSHSHAVHIRFFWRRLEQHDLHSVKFGPSGSSHWRVAASVHYEVEHANPLHADVEVCPICGRTGAYTDKEGNLVEHVHDPLGLELLLWGTVRGERVLNMSLAKDAKDIVVIRPTRDDMNTDAIATVRM